MWRWWCPTGYRATHSHCDVIVFTYIQLWSVFIEQKCFENPVSLLNGSNFLKPLSLLIWVY